MSNEDITLPARHKIGDLVTITARVAGIQYAADKVRYAFDIGEMLSIVDSEHVQPKVEQAGPVIEFDVSNVEGAEQGRSVNVVATLNRAGGKPPIRYAVWAGSEKVGVVLAMDYLLQLLSGNVRNSSDETVKVEL